jgi:hypothetical protein
LEFYTFAADNYAPFYTLPIECTDREAASYSMVCFTMRASSRSKSITPTPYTVTGGDVWSKSL